jgi:hypothetical protein
MMKFDPKGVNSHPVILADSESEEMLTHSECQSMVRNEEDEWKNFAGLGLQLVLIEKEIERVSGSISPSEAVITAIKKGFL